MFIRTIKDLRQHLSEQGISPEDLARQTRISNMTIRRMLEKADDAIVAPKYHPALDLYIRSRTGEEGSTDWIVPSSMDDFEPILADLQAQGEKPCEIPALKKQLQEKLSSTLAFQSIREHTTTLLRFLNKRRSAARTRAIAIGALMYFLNPADMIPDLTPGVGFFDDFAILSLVVKIIAETDQEQTPA